MKNALFDLIDGFAQLKILVIGEAMLDRYYKGASTRLSQEAPVQVVNIAEKEDLPGGAANTAANIRSLGATPVLLSVIGDDEEGAVLRATLKQFDIADAYTLSEPGRKTLAKQRILANQQMMLRFDQGSTIPIHAETEQRLIQALLELAPQVDGILISDYDYGILTPGVLNALADLQKKEPHLLVVDAKRYSAYQPLHVTAIKPNYAEAVRLLRLEARDDEQERVQQIEAHGRALLDLAGAQAAAVTLDRSGALIFERNQPAYRIYARPAGTNRVAGAGDTFISALALALAAGAPTTTAAEIASSAAAVVVEKPGTSRCSIEELKGYCVPEEKFIPDTFQMAARLAAHRGQGKRIVFTNGCFDLLHSGHIQYLNQAKALGDILIVGINTDESVKRIKGPLRPINPLEERIRVLSALSCVDYVLVFDEDIPNAVIRLVRPEIFVKGGDYQRADLPEAALVEEMGGQVVILPYIEAQSTSGMIERVRQAVSHTPDQKSQGDTA